MSLAHGKVSLNIALLLKPYISEYRILYRIKKLIVFHGKLKYNENCLRTYTFSNSLFSIEKKNNIGELS